MFYGKGSERAAVPAAQDDPRRRPRTSGGPRSTSCSRSSSATSRRTLEAMDGLPVTIRLLDPPLHEFVPQARGRAREAGRGARHHASRSSTSAADALHETNPMMGHRGVRLGITYPGGHRDAGPRDLRGRRRAASRKARRPCPRSWSRSSATVNELDDQKAIVDRVHAEVCAKYGRQEDRAPVRHDDRDPARGADRRQDRRRRPSSSRFGTNDLTQMTFGFRRDDIGGFLPDYLDKKHPAGRPVPDDRPGRRRRS